MNKYDVQDHHDIIGPHENNSVERLLTIILIFACSCVFQHRTVIAAIAVISAVFVVCHCRTFNGLKLK